MLGRARARPSAQCPVPVPTTKQAHGSKLHLSSGSMCRPWPTPIGESPGAPSARGRSAQEQSKTSPLKTSPLKLSTGRPLKGSKYPAIVQAGPTPIRESPGAPSAAGVGGSLRTPPRWLVGCWFGWLLVWLVVGLVNRGAQQQPGTAWVGG